MAETTSVPNLIGLMRLEAESKLKSVSLVVGKVTTVSSAMPNGSISSAKPAAGVVVSIGTPVDLEVSNGPANDAAQVAVPNLVGLTRPDAEAKLKSANLVTGTVTTVSGAMPSGNVSGAKPTAGVLVSKGAPVDLEVSSGPASGATQVAVPNVVGLTRPAAEAKLKSVGLEIGAVTTRHSDSVPPDGVRSTIPESGTPLSLQSPVDLQLSSGPEPNWTQYISPVLFGLLGLTVLGIIIFGVTQSSGTFLARLAEKEIARGLITFLIAITTVGIAIILAISTLILAEGDAGDKRFDRGKQVLTILIGVLGTIVGFYFGSAPDGKSPQQVQTLAITSTTLPDGTTGVEYSAMALRTTGGKAPLTWSVKPDLPADLKLDETTGTISGKPKVAKAKTDFTFTVTDSSAPALSATKALTLEIK